MSKGVVIHLDNEKQILDPAKNLFDQYEFGLQYKTCTTKEEFATALDTHGKEVKAIIFDLLGEKDLQDENPEFLDSIQKTFTDFSIPVFIYSGYLEALKGKFDNCGTVYKFDKGDGELASIFEKFELLYDSGFVDIFCPGGLLETEIHLDLHKAFTTQFNHNSQIEGIIQAISDASKEEKAPRDRVQKVFKRVAIRSLLSGLLEPEVLEEGATKPEFLNPIEHYLQRISSFEFWTGDIFENNENTEMLLILTPRCNVASSKFKELLVCEIIEKDFPSKVKSKKDKDKVKYALTDKPEVSGYDRYLPPSPLFKGGKVELSNYYMITKENLNENFRRIISLSDELTNEILGKFGAYFFRTGINPWSQEETIAFLEKTQKEDAKE